MRITGADCTILSSSESHADPLNTAHDNAVVRVYTDGEISGTGEVECNPWVVKALVESSGSHRADRSLAELITGQDPAQPAAIWDHLYKHTILTGRRGAGINAIGALDIAVWDIYGLSVGRPVWELLGGAARERVIPYASLLPYGSTLPEYRDNLIRKMTWARDAGYRAVKAEILIKGPYAQPGLDECDESVVELVGECRRAIGNKVQLLIDVGYCWTDWKAALRCITQMEQYDPYLIETPLQPDDIAGYANLCKAADVPIAAGELLSTRFEFEQWMNAGAMDIVQPDVGRVGGITEAMRVIASARDRGKLAIPHCWKSGIGIAATAHVSAASPNCPMIEFLPAPVSGSVLRQSLLESEIVPRQGVIDLPRAPGLGLVLNQQTLANFAVDQPHSNAASIMNGRRGQST